MGKEIPIRNIYYLLCYAWNRLSEGEIVDVSKIDTTELADLFATVLINGTNHLLRKGLDRGYQSISDEIHAIRGRIDVAVTARRMLIKHGRVCCSYDDFNVNTLPNRILKSTIRFLSGIPTLDTDLKKRLLVLYRDLWQIDDVQLTKHSFRKVQLHTNNRFYRFLLNICEFIQGAWLIDEHTGDYKFRDFVRDPKQMALLFEKFVYNFYRFHLSDDYQIKIERIKWAGTSEVDPELSYLPEMKTDISLRCSGRTIIVDTKYYLDTLQSYREAETIHSANLYQLFAYLKNIATRGGSDAYAEGMLLYPMVDKKIRLSYLLHGHKITINTVDLGKDWKEIKNELFEIVAN